MYPFSVLTDENVSLKFPKTRYIIIDIFNNKHTINFGNNTQLCMYKNLEINNMFIHFSHLLLALNVPLRIGKCTPGGTCTPGWEPLIYNNTDVTTN